MLKKQTNFIRGHAAFKHVLNPIYQIGFILVIALVAVIGVIIANAHATQGDVVATGSFTCSGVTGTISYSEAGSESTPSVSGTYNVTVGTETVVSGASYNLNAGNGYSQAISHSFSVGNGATVTIDIVSRSPSVTSPSSFPIFITDDSQQVTGCADNMTLNLVCNSSNGSFTASGNANFAGETINIGISSVMGSYVSQGTTTASSTFPYSYSFSGSGAGDGWWAEAFGVMGTGPETQFPASNCGTPPPPTPPSGTIACTTMSDMEIEVTGTITANPDTLNVRIYDVTDAAALGGTFTSGSQTETDSGLTPSTAYTYRLQYNNGSSWVDISGVNDTCTTSASVTPPTGTIACTAVLPTQIDITATVTTNPDTLNMRIFKVGDSQLGGTFTTGTENRTDTAVVSGNSYTYRLQYSDGSNWINVSGVSDTCTGQVPSLELKKYVTVASGTDELAGYAGTQLDAQSAPGPDIGYNINVEYVITVENTGDTAIFIGGEANSDATYEVADDMCDTAVTYQEGDTTDNDILDTDETWIYTCTINNVTAQTTNTASVVGNPVDGAGSDIGGESDLTDNDPANVNPVPMPGIELIKYVTIIANPDSLADQLASHPGDQRNANSSPGPMIPRGSDVEYVITVENTGDTELFVGGYNNNGTTYNISDDQCDTTPITDGAGDLDANVLLSPGETWIYTCTKNDVTEQTTNTACVDANPVDASGANLDTGDTQNDCNDANVEPNNPDLALIKTTESESVGVDGEVTFTITVHNQGDVDAQNVQIIDYIPANMTLSESSESTWTESSDGTTATTTIVGPIEQGETSSVDIVLAAPTSPWDGNTDALTNYAEIASAEDIYGQNLDDIDSTADSDISNDCGGEVNSSNDDRLDGDGVAGDGCDEDDHDPENIVFIPIAAIDIEKLVGYPDLDEEKFDADTEEDRVAVATGADATITIYVANVGKVELQLNEDQPEVDEVCQNLSIYDQGDDDENDILSVGEVWTYTCIIEDVFEPGTCDISVTANPVTPDGEDITVLEDVSDEDPIFLDIGGDLFGLTVEGALEDTGVGAMTFVTAGTSLVGGALAATRLGLRRRLARNEAEDIDLDEIARLIARSGALAIEKQTITAPTETREQQNHSSGSSGARGRDGVLFKV